MRPLNNIKLFLCESAHPVSLVTKIGSRNILNTLNVADARTLNLYQPWIKTKKKIIFLKLLAFSSMASPNIYVYQTMKDANELWQRNIAFRQRH